MSSATSELSSPGAQSEGTFLQLRPGANIFEVSPEQLQISFANHTATFQGVPVVKGMRVLLALLETGRTGSELISGTADQTGLQTTFVQYLLDLLAGSECLFEGASPEACYESDALGRFYASIGHDPAKNLAKLAAARPILVLPRAASRSLEEKLRAAGISAEFVEMVSGERCDRGLEKVGQAVRNSSQLILSWGLPYRSPIARLLNDLALESRSPILFGCCEGLTGRIGPYIIPRDTPCLECLNNRILANSGPPERTAYAHYRARYSDTIGEPWPSHPVFEGAVEGLFVLELAQILLQLPPRTIAAVVESSFVDASITRHPFYRVPRCESCHPARPPRMPWDIKFAAPVVKGGSE